MASSDWRSLPVWSALVLPPMLLLLLLDNIAHYGDAGCIAGIQPKDVNESTAANWSIQDLDATYQLSATPGVDSVYACYFWISAGALRLRRQFDLENFTSCLDGSVVPMASVQTVQTVTIPCVSGDTATFLVRLVDINEFPPEFIPNVFRLNVSEATANGTLVIQLNTYVIDRDISNRHTFNFQIVNGSNGDFAMTDGVTSGIVRIQQPLDYDAGTRQYVLNISAADLPTDSASLPTPLTGYATVIVNVIDADDMNPYFLQNQYSFYFMENDTSYMNRPLSTNPPLEARDGDVGINQTINYAIESAMWSGSTGSLLGNVTFLSIDHATGQLTVLTLVDREALPSSTLLVQVKGYQTDKPQTRICIALLIVTVGDKNDNAPVMESALYNVSIAENSLVGSYVTTVKATDADLGANATVTFKVNDTSGAFQVDPETGLVTVADSSILDREIRSIFVMKIWARESATPEQFASPASLVVVNLLDVNDNSPVFAPPNASYAFRVSGDAPVGAAVGSVVATDADQGANGLVRFAVAWTTGGCAGALFQLDPVSGALATKASLAGVSTATTVCVLQVVAEDQATPANLRRLSSAIVEITVSPVETTAAATTSDTTADSTSSTSSTSSPSTSTSTSSTSSTISTSSTSTSTSSTSTSSTSSTSASTSTSAPPTDTSSTVAVSSSTVAISVSDTQAPSTTAPTTVSTADTVTTGSQTSTRFQSTTISSYSISSSSVSDSTTTAVPTDVADAWNASASAVTAVWLVNESFALVKLEKTQTSASGNLSTTTQFTLLPYNSTVAPVADAAASAAGVQIALIVICAILLLAVIGLVAMLIWCWSTHQRRPLKAVSATPLPGSQARVTNGNADHHQQQQPPPPPPPPPPQVAAEAAAPAVVAVAPSNATEAAYPLQPMPRANGDMPRRDGLASAGVASLFLGLSPRHASPTSLTTASPATGEAECPSPSRDSIGSTFDWLTDEAHSSTLAAGNRNYWCLPASVTVDTAL